MKDNISKLPARPQTTDDYIHAANMMEVMGGGFAMCIAHAYYKADMNNQARLRAAFPDLFTEFFNEYLQHQQERRREEPEELTESKS